VSVGLAAAASKALDCASRSVHIAGITPHPDSRRMTQIARNLTDIEGGFLRSTQYLILDRDTKPGAPEPASRRDA
jgi:hypothetical protein